jgi:hypothetical protein
MGAVGSLCWWRSLLAFAVAFARESSTRTGIGSGMERLNRPPTIESAGPSYPHP